jgi:CMP-N-acetylneuraminic acid synthetase
MSIVAIVPALESNKYSSDGDLAPWGDSNLLEWKISQLKSVSRIDRIFVSTDSDKIIEIANQNGVEFLKRNSNLSLKESLLSVCSNLKLDDDILWANPTSPFVGGSIFNSIINEYFLSDCPVDGIVASRVQYEFLYKESGPLNFDDSSIISRNNLQAVHLITNGAYFSRCKNVIKKEKMFGHRPVFFEVPWLASLEIREKEQMSLFSSLIHKYFQEEF